MKKKILRICAGIFILCFVFLVQVNIVSAKTLSIDDIIKEFQQSEYMGIFEKERIVVKNNTTDKMIEVYIDNVKKISFKYYDDYIEYEDYKTNITEQNLLNSIIIPAYSTMGIIESILKLSEQEISLLKAENYFDSTYEEYGLLVETEDFKFEGSDETDSTDISGKIIRHFKISLDTEMIDKLVQKYGINSIIESLISKLKVEAKEITDNSVSLYVNITDDINTNLYQDLICELYRSDTEDGNYEKIPNVQLYCLDSKTGYVDKNLNSNTTYYYKAKIIGSDKYSEPIKVSTKELNLVDKNNVELEKQEENPKTSDINNNLALLILAGSIGLIAIGKKKLKKLSK